MTRLSEQAALAIILILVPLCLQACILPIPWGEERFSQADISNITLALSSKDVVERFGSPDVIWEIGPLARVFVYKWERLRAILVAGGFGILAVAGLSTDEALLILFDEADHVARSGRAIKSPFESYGDFLTRWLPPTQD